jgi:hypothetical protein
MRVKRSFLAVVILATVVSLGLPGVSVAQSTAPTLILEQNCFLSGASQVYGIRVGVTGFPPNTSFEGLLEFRYVNPTTSTGGTFGPAILTTDANGNWGPATLGSSVPAIWTATVSYFGGTLTKTITVTCSPTQKTQCKHGGWRNFAGFRNEGACVAFVERRPKP